MTKAEQKLMEYLIKCLDNVPDEVGLSQQEVRWFKKEFAQELQLAKNIQLEQNKR